MRRGFFASPWTISIGGTAIGTALVTWRWPDVKPYLTPAWTAVAATAHYFSGTVQVRVLTLWVLIAALLVFAVPSLRRVLAATGATLPAELPADFKPAARQAIALRCAYEHHPRSVGLYDVVVVLRERLGLYDVTQALAERVLEELCEIGAMQPVALHLYRLTPAGLSYCHGWDDWAREHQQRP